MHAKLHITESGLAATAARPDDSADLAAWAGARADHVFVLEAGDDGSLRLRDLGPRPEACREPINIVYDLLEPALQPVSNLARTPFRLDGRDYASIEGFWQGLKFDDETARARIAALHGHEARLAGLDAAPVDTIHYAGRAVGVGTHEHRELMRLACRAKFDQHAGAAAALLSTGTRPLVHRVDRDSRTIPGAIMAEIWTGIRDSLRRRRDGTLPD